MQRGYAVTVAHNVPEGIAAAGRGIPEYAVVDLRMPGPSGLELVRHLKQLDENTRIVVLTGYASIATAVEAIKPRRHSLSVEAGRCRRDCRGLRACRGTHRCAGQRAAAVGGACRVGTHQGVLTGCGGNISGPRAG